MNEVIEAIEKFLNSGVIEDYIEFINPFCTIDDMINLYFLSNEDHFDLSVNEVKFYLKIRLNEKYYEYLTVDSKKNVYL